MRLKSVRVKGFKSFSSDTTIALHPHINVIVGRNGSGKSNLFSAVSLLLQADTISAAERKAIAHSGGAGIEVPTEVVVEVAVDNTDRRMAVGSDEVVIRRTIYGHKTDAITVNGRSTTKKDFISLMESAGFSRSNPFFLVHQGQVSDLASCKMEKRLAVVQELAGVTSYNEKKAAAAAKFREIDRDIETSRGELDRLMADAEQLKKTEKMAKRLVAAKDREAAIRFALVEKSQERIHGEMKEVEKKKEKEMRRLAVVIHDCEVAEEEANKAKESFDKVSSLLDTKLELKHKLMGQANETDSEKCRLEMETKHAEKAVTENRQKLAETEAKCERGRDRCSREEAKLGKLKEKWSAAKAASDEADLKLKLKKDEQADLYARANRRDAFRNEEERTEWLAGEIGKAEEELAKASGKENELKDTLRRVQKDMATQLDRVGELEQVLHAHRSDKKDALEAINSLERQIVEMANEEKVARQSLLTLTEELNQLREEQARIRSECLKDPRMRPVILGKESMTTVLDNVSDEIRAGFLGIVAERFTSDTNLDTAVSVALGPKFYHMIVKTAATGTALCKAMSQMGLPGEVTFFALDKLKRRESPAYPAELRRRGRPLLEHVECDAEVAPVFKHLFGNYALVSDMEVFRSFRGTKWNCITLAGDEMSSLGVMRGGHHRPRMDSAVHLGRMLLETHTNLGLTKTQVEKAKAKLEEMQTNLASSTSDLLKRKNKGDWYEKKIEDARQSISVAQVSADARGREQLPKLEAELRRNTTRRSEAAEKKRRLELELADDDGKWSTQQGICIVRDIEDLTAEAKNLFKEKNTAEQRKNEAEVKCEQLKKILKEKTAEIQNLAECIDADEKRISLQTLKLHSATEENQHFKSELNRLNEEVDVVVKKKVKFSKLVDDTTSTAETSKEALQAGRTAYDGHCRKAASLQQKADEARAKYTSLIVPRKEELDRAMEKSERQLRHDLAALSKQLEKFGKNGVDERVLERRKKIVAGLNDFRARMETLVEEKQHLQRLGEDIELKKREKVHFTYAQIEEYYKQTFAKLVPNGSASLNFKLPPSRASGYSSSDPESSSSQGSQPPDEPVGIELEVSFSGGAPLTDITLLSGGQKALAAICFFFALHRCDPVPFYVFDEIDAALDDAHRDRVVRYMASMEGVQFVCTTFRPEFVSLADHCIGVRFSGNSSTASVVDKNEALAFVSEEDEENSRATR